MDIHKNMLKAPPPLVFLAAYFAGVGLERFAPHLDGVSLVAGAARPVGIVLVCCGVVLSVCCAIVFVVKRTTMIPYATASSLITWGPYRFSRNPMYVSVAMMYIGAAIGLVQIWPLLFLPFPVLFLDRLVIPFEEARLREVFGEDYDGYCARVRRWL